MSLRAAIDVLSGKPSNAVGASATLLFEQLRKFAIAEHGVSTVKMHSNQGKQLAASGTISMDLAGGVLDQDGNAITFTKVYAIIVNAYATNVNKVNVGGAASNTFVGPFADATDKIQVSRNSSLFVTMAASSAAGWTVTAGTGDILLVANSSSGSAVTYDIIIIGDTA